MAEGMEPRKLIYGKADDVILSESNIYESLWQDEVDFLGVCDLGTLDIVGISQLGRSYLSFQIWRVWRTSDNKARKPNAR